MVLHHWLLPTGAVEQLRCRPSAMMEDVESTVVPVAASRSCARAGCATRAGCGFRRGSLPARSQWRGRCAAARRQCRDRRRRSIVGRGRRPRRHGRGHGRHDHLSGPQLTVPRPPVVVRSAMARRPSSSPGSAPVSQSAEEAALKAARVGSIPTGAQRTHSAATQDAPRPTPPGSSRCQPRATGRMRLFGQARPGHRRRPRAPRTVRTCAARSTRGSSESAGPWSGRSAASVGPGRARRPFPLQ